jgi:N-methylhydantoinase B/oxoprolinase/acetone carboxylase alpha subunit
MSTAAGGCGYGDPFTRDPEDVREDVIDSYVSIENARLDYGVVINPESFEIDIKATQKLRNKGYEKDLPCR